MIMTIVSQKSKMDFIESDHSQPRIKLWKLQAKNQNWNWEKSTYASFPWFLKGYPKLLRYLFLGTLCGIFYSQLFLTLWCQNIAVYVRINFQKVIQNLSCRIYWKWSHTNSHKPWTRLVASHSWMCPEYLDDWKI